MERSQKDYIKSNLQEIQSKIKNAILLAVTKKRSIEEIKILKSLGQNIFGENRVDEAEEKIENIDAEWHMIGHLQSNKARKAVELFDCIESVDSLKIAEKINRISLEMDKKTDIFIQVNIGKEEQKYGITPEKTIDFIDKIKDLKGIRIIGLMAIAPFVEKKQTRDYFRKMYNIFKLAKTKFPNLGMHHLSMGMSNDYDVAIEEGSTIVRIGTKIFESK